MRIPKLILKHSARIEGIYPEIQFAITVAYSLWCAYQFPGDCRVTSGTDDAPGRLEDSLHKIGQAFDLGIWGLNYEDLKKMEDGLKKALGVEFDVILEKDHFHIEFQPKPI